MAISDPSPFADTEGSIYLRCAEFIEYPEHGRTLFLPIETVVAAFG